MEAPVDGLQQQRQVQGLGEVLVHPRLPAALDVIGYGSGGHGNDGDRPGVWPVHGPDAPAHLKAVDIGQHDVQQGHPDARVLLQLGQGDRKSVV